MNLSDFLMCGGLFNDSGGSSGATVDDGHWIAWDGDTTGKDAALLVAGEEAMTYYKVSDRVFTPSELNGSVVNEFGTTSMVSDVVDSSLFGFEAGLFCLTNTDKGMTVVSGQAVDGSGSMDGMEVNITIPSDGTYFLCTNMDGTPLYVFELKKAVMA